MTSVCPQGQVDDITMVSFVGGIFLDNISLMTGSDSYRDAYEEFKQEGEFVGSHHTIGLGGRWDLWQELGEWVAETTEGDINDCGAYVFRETARDIEPSFIEKINTADKSPSDSATDIFLDMLNHESFDRTENSN